MSLMPFKGRCIHCGHDHGNSDFYGDDPIRYQERLKAQAMLEKVAVHVLEKQIATLTRQRDLAVEAASDAATSLETIQLRSFGEESYLDSKPQMRAFAGARAKIARDTISTIKES